ncbi:MAG: hypothetical protein A3H42_01935 [Deltaproteobacteria bacterium RIFCSPLOWO2_02_FULL_46_8]|nr:MAG: hypothetical protein A3H42_01935 [Deltaproteobacteria bacterium RIFCSPLOWO2_02_FULL_46_8]
MEMGSATIFTMETVHNLWDGSPIRTPAVGIRTKKQSDKGIVTKADINHSLYRMINTFSPLYAPLNVILNALI